MWTCCFIKTGNRDIYVIPLTANMEINLQLKPSGLTPNLSIKRRQVTGRNGVTRRRSRYANLVHLSHSLSRTPILYRIAVRLVTHLTLRKSSKKKRGWEIDINFNVF